MNFDPQPGDIVTIRTWDDMVEEYGLNESGGIKTPYLTILRGMKQYCGHSYSVVRAYDTFDKRSYSFMVSFLLPYLCSCRLFFLPTVHSHFLNLF